VFGSELARCERGGLSRSFALNTGRVWAVVLTISLRRFVLVELQLDAVDDNVLEVAADGVPWHPHSVHLGSTVTGEDARGPAARSFPS
jgi:hypothetical protein